jgi:hypothetical protein
VGVADEALAAESDTERTVDEVFKGDIALCGNGGNLVHRQFAGQHDLRETGIFEECHFGRIAIVGLRAGMQLDWWQIHFEQSHILHDQRIGPCFVSLPGHLAGPVEFVIAQDGVEGDKHFGIEAMGVAAEAFDIGQRIASIGTGTKGRATDINGVGTMVDGFNAEIGVLGRRKEFERVVGAGHLDLVSKAWRKFFDIEFVQDGFGAFAGILPPPKGTSCGAWSTAIFVGF